MAYSINIRSDNHSANAVRSLWQTCSFLEASPSMTALNYPPHITLAVYDEIDRSDLFAALDSVFSAQARFSIRFEQLGTALLPGNGH